MEFDEVEADSPETPKPSNPHLEEKKVRDPPRLNDLSFALRGTMTNLPFLFKDQNKQREKERKRVQLTSNGLSNKFPLKAKNRSKTPSLLLQSSIYASTPSFQVCVFEAHIISTNYNPFSD